MNLTTILSRKGSMKRAFVELESDMDDMLKEEFLLPPELESAETGEVQPEELLQDIQDETLPGAPILEEATAEEAPVDHMNAHAQGRITDIAAFDETRNLVQQQRHHPTVATVQRVFRRQVHRIQQQGVQQQ